ncbi:MAG: hypothetical protein ABI528_06495 [bacterium]
MKKYSAVFILIILVSVGSKDILSQTTPELMDEISEKVEVIGLDATLKTVSLLNDEFLHEMTDGGGELKGYYRDNLIYHINQTVGISYGIYVTEYYYSSNKLIFVNEKFNQFYYDTLTTSLDYTKTETTYDGSYFFNNGKLIHSTSAGYSRFEADSIDVAKTLTTESDEAFDLILKKINSSR